MSMRARGVPGSNASPRAVGSDHDDESDDDAPTTPRRHRSKEASLASESSRRRFTLSTGQWTFLCVALVTVYVVHFTPPPEDSRPRRAPEPFNPEDVWKHMVRAARNKKKRLADQQAIEPPQCNLTGVFFFPRCATP